MCNFFENNPTVDILVNSMRSMGYSFESAIADIVDNSISAKASIIELKFPIDPSECYIAICDNGIGMSKEKLIEAMKYGSKTDNGERAEDDLGRFGLGLKAASLSQCKRLTVISKFKNRLTALTWDIDIISKRKGWWIEDCPEDRIKSLKFASFLDNYNSGTIVLWEKFDFIEKSSGNVYAELNKYLESVSNYLSLIFHRYLNNPSLNKRIKIKINNYEIKGLDPFLENHSKTNIRKEFAIAIIDSKGIERTIKVQPYILPFQKDLSETDKKISGGIENYRSKQGFYIYRNERLIIWGTWFGKHKDELTKHARIRVDIPNTLDDIWSIDIKKQNAKIPASIKNRLSQAVEEAMNLSVKAQTFRGRVTKVNSDIDYIWDRIKEREEQFSYKINRNSKIFDLIKKKTDDETWAYIDMVLEEIENTIPYQQIYIDKSQNKITEEISQEKKEEIKNKAIMLLNLANPDGTFDIEAIIENIFKSEPFCNFPDLKIQLIKEFK